MNHRTAGEGGGHFFNSSLPPPSQTLRHQAITAESSLLYIEARLEPGTFGFGAQVTNH